MITRNVKQNTSISGSSMNGVIVQGGVNSNGKINYSTDEQVIGTWIDRKSIYQKTYKIEFDSYSEFNSQITNIFNNNYIDTCISVMGCSKSKTIKDNIPYTFSGTYSLYELCFATDDTNSMTIDLSPIYVTIQYTKTTD